MPINRWGTSGMLFDDGAIASGTVSRRLIQSAVIVRPSGGSGLRPYTLGARQDA